MAVEAGEAGGINVWPFMDGRECKPPFSKALEMVWGRKEAAEAIEVSSLHPFWFMNCKEEFEFEFSRGNWRFLTILTQHDDLNFRAVTAK